MNKIAKRYNRYSYVYDFFELLPEKLIFAKHRKRIIPLLNGKILEVGVGTGKNLPYYNNEADVTAIDFSPKMLNRAKFKLKKLGKKNITLREANVEQLPFSDNTFDFVVATCVFCSVPNPIQGFNEIKRVLKGNGKAIFLEHVRSENKIIGKLQDILNPLSVGIFGFNVNRRTKENITRSDLSLIQDEKINHEDILRLFKCKKDEYINKKALK